MHTSFWLKRLQTCFEVCKGGNQLFGTRTAPVARQHAYIGERHFRVRAVRTVSTCRTLRAFWALRTFGTFWALRTLGTLRTLRTLRTFGAWRARTLNRLHLRSHLFCESRGDSQRY